MTQETQENVAIAIYHTHHEAEEAIKALQRGGFDMTKLSIVGRDYHTEEHVVGYYNTGDRMKAWGKIGAFWGGLWGLLCGGWAQCAWGWTGQYWHAQRQGDSV